MNMLQDAPADGRVPVHPPCGSVGIPDLAPILPNTQKKPMTHPMERRRPSFVERGVSFYGRLRWMTPLAGGFMQAAAVLVRIRWDRNAVQSVPYGVGSVSFRGHDEQALREVLVDREYTFLTDLLAASPAPTILDLGAHIGTFAIWSLGVNPKARVFSIEADPGTYRVAEWNVAAFAKQGADWRVIHAAAGSEDGAKVRLSNAGPSMSHRIDPDGTVEVESVSLTTLLDRVAADGAPVDLVKIDIEGSEEALLCATPDALNRVTALVVELHPNLCDTARVEAVLARYFDRIDDIGGRKSTKPLLFCRRSTPGSAA